MRPDTSAPRLTLALIALIVLLAVSAYPRAHERLNAPKPTVADPLDPNDCSRGIDEANQEACDP